MNIHHVVFELSLPQENDGKLRLFSMQMLHLLVNGVHKVNLLVQSKLAMALPKGDLPHQVYGRQSLKVCTVVTGRLYYSHCDNAPETLENMIVICSKIRVIIRYNITSSLILACILGPKLVCSKSNAAMLDFLFGPQHYNSMSISALQNLKF